MVNHPSLSLMKFRCFKAVLQYSMKQSTQTECRSGHWYTATKGLSGEMEACTYARTGNMLYRRAETFREEKFSLFSRMAQIREILSAKIFCAKFSRRGFSRYRLPIPYSANIPLYTYFRFCSAKIKTLLDPDDPLASTIKPEVMIEQRKREKMHNHRQRVAKLKPRKCIFSLNLRNFLP